MSPRPLDTHQATIYSHNFVIFIPMFPFSPDNTTKKLRTLCRPVCVKCLVIMQQLYAFMLLSINVICPAFFRKTCQWLKFPLNGLRAQSRVSPVVRLLPLASGPACLGMAFPPFLVKQLYRCDSVVISLFVRTW